MTGAAFLGSHSVTRPDPAARSWCADVRHRPAAESLPANDRSYSAGAVTREQTL